jgi:excisionase family DNA binding protein
MTPSSERIGPLDVTRPWERLLSVNEAAVFLGLSVGTVYHMVSEKRLPVVRISKRCIRFRLSDLVEWANARLEMPR